MSIVLFDPSAVIKSYEALAACFSGEIFYAVKANPSPEIMTVLSNCGVTGFDVASLNEIEAVRSLDQHTPLVYTHPVKSRDAIETAYGRWGVRTFVVDSIAELHKIALSCPQLDDVEIFVRVKSAEPTGTQLINFDGKFGAEEVDVIRLAQCIEHYGAELSLSFHAGSQQTNPAAYWKMLEYLAALVEQHALKVRRISIGGGFPVNYEPHTRYRIQDIVPGVETIKQRFPALRHVTFMAEPGRYLSAESMTLLTEVLLVDKDRVFVSESIYKSLLDCALLNARFPIVMETPGKSKINKQYRIFGCTCDSLDQLPGHYQLPADLSEGDVLRICNVGAYGFALTDNFNGLCAKPSLSFAADYSLEQQLHNSLRSI
jgi:ornithine decarboxylase